MEPIWEGGSGVFSLHAFGIAIGYHSLGAWYSVRLLFSHRENVNRGKGIFDVTNYLAR